MRALTDELARAMTLEGGKPLVENSDEVGWTAAAFDYYAEMGRNFAGRVIPSIEATQLALVVKEPIGVWGVHRAVELPAAAARWKLAPALAAGNTVVAKPSELTPLSTLMLAECFADLPPGVVNVVAGAGDVGAALVDDPRIEGVAFTGSVETGKKVAAACAERVARMNLEMGGKDPFIVCADVAGDVEVAARGGAWAAYLNAGQVCTSAERFYVAREVYDDFVSEFVDHARSLRVGDPLDAIDRRRADGVGAAAGEGGGPGRGGRGGRRRAARGRRPRRARPRATTTRPRWSPARRPRPTCCARRPSARWRRSCRWTRSTRRSGWPTPRRFGLGANVYTRDLETAVRCMREIRAGTVWINDPLTDNDAGPFGGMKQSGFGRELGQEGLEAFQETKHVHIETKIAPKEWWYPYGPGALGAPAPVPAPVGRAASASENAVSSSSWTSPPPRRSTSRSANTQIARSSVARSAFFARASPSCPPTAAPSASPTFASGMPAPSSDAARCTSRSRRTTGKTSRPAARRATRAARRARACLEVAGHERVGEVVGPGAVSPAASRSTSAAVDVRARMQRERELLELAREPLLARPDPRHELLGRLAVELEAELAGVPDAPLGQLPRLRAPRTRAPRRRPSRPPCESCLAPCRGRSRTSTVSGGRSARAGSSGPSSAGLPGADVVHQQVARAGVEGQRRERRRHLGRLARAGVEDLEPARPALLLGAPAHARAPGVDLGVVVAADEVGGLQVGHGGAV